jgi:hypothetical protein
VFNSGASGRVMVIVALLGGAPFSFADPPIVNGLLYGDGDQTLTLEEAPSRVRPEVRTVLDLEAALRPSFGRLMARRHRIDLLRPHDSLAGDLPRAVVTARPGRLNAPAALLTARLRSGLDHLPG